jgi:hypothetical protein
MVRTFYDRELPIPNVNVRNPEGGEITMSKKSSGKSKGSKGLGHPGKGIGKLPKSGVGKSVKSLFGK